MLVFEVEPGLFRGPRPSGDDDYLQLKKLGVQCILNVEGGFWGWLSGDQNTEFMDAYRHGFELNHLPMGAVFPPDVHDVYFAVTFLRNRKVPTYLHCLEGRDRTGFLIAVYRMLYNNYSYDAAVKEMRAHNFHNYYFYWLPALKEWSHS